MAYNADAHSRYLDSQINYRVERCGQTIQNAMTEVERLTAEAAQQPVNAAGIINPYSRRAWGDD